MSTYYKDKFNNLHTINHNTTNDDTILCIICIRENKPIDNKIVTITNGNITYSIPTDQLGYVQLVVEPGLYTITMDECVIEQEVKANATTTVEIKAQYSVFGLLYNDKIANSQLCLNYSDDSLLVKDWNTENLFINIKPCIVKNGVRQYYLNPNDLTKTIDGQNIDFSNPAIGDVMIEIPKIGIKFDTYKGQQRIRVTNNPNLLNEGFHYYAHTREQEGDRDYLYVGAFLGSLIGTQLRSLGDQNLFVTNRLDDLRDYARANGQGYDLLSFYPYVLLQILFLLKYKNLNSQEALGMGYCSSLNTHYIKTGNTYSKGMDYGSVSGTIQMKFAGIEDLWGNNNCYIDGIYFDNDHNIKTAFTGFNNAAIGYISQGNSITYPIEGYLSKTTFSAECGFLPLVATGDNYIYYSDKIQRANNTGMVVGGKYNDSYEAGLFLSRGYYYTKDISARLMYL